MNEQNQSKEIILCPGVFALRACVNGQPYPLDKEIISVGRVSNMDVFVDSKTVSRHHATLRFENGVWFVVDEGSTNMTRVNHAFIFPGQKYLINPGDLLSFGDQEFVFTYDPTQAKAPEVEAPAAEKPAKEEAAAPFAIPGKDEPAAPFAIPGKDEPAVPFAIPGKDEEPVIEESIQEEAAQEPAEEPSVEEEPKQEEEPAVEEIAVEEPAQPQYDEQSVQVLREAIRAFVVSGYRDGGAYGAIVNVLSDAPLYAAVSCEGDGCLQTLRLQDGQDIVPLFTTEEEIAKSGLRAERFVPAKLFPLLAQLGFAAVIDLFDEFRFMVAFELITDTILPAISAKQPPMPVSEPEPEVAVESAPEVVSEPEPEILAEPEPEIVPEVEPEVIPEAEPVIIPEPQPELFPEPEQVTVPEVEPEAVPEAEPVVIPEPQSEPLPEPEAVPVPEPQPAAEATRVFRPPVTGPGMEIPAQEKPEEPREKLIAGKYRLCSVISSAGLVKSVRAEDVQTQKAVLLEMCDKTDPRYSEEFRAFFMNGRNAMLQLKQPVLAQVLELMENDRAICVVREPLDGINMAAKVTEEGAQPFADAVRWIKHLCFAVQYLHSKGYVYGNLKPSNLLLLPGCGHIKLAGLEEVACRGENAVAVYGEGVCFAAPEVFDGKADVRSDVYGLGMNLYYMLSGKTEPGEQLPEAVAEIVAKCVSQDPAQRYGDVMELLFDLEMVAI